MPGNSIEGLVSESACARRELIGRHMIHETPSAGISFSLLNSVEVVYACTQGAYRLYRLLGSLCSK